MGPAAAAAAAAGLQVADASQGGTSNLKEAATKTTRRGPVAARTEFQPAASGWPDS